MSPSGKGERTRATILTLAVDIASREGLESLTIGRLAEQARMSKGGLFAHFGSKEDLQLATVEFARETFVREVINPALGRPRGLARLAALCAAWLSYVERSVFSGGCFFAAAAAEFDSRPGPVRDRVAEAMRSWLDMLEAMARQAKASGELDSDVNPRQLAFELNSLAMGANWQYVLFDDRSVFKRARVAIEAALRRAASQSGQSFCLLPRAAELGEVTPP